jgi:hypothetical protein
LLLRGLPGRKNRIAEREGVAGETTLNDCGAKFIRRCANCAARTLLDDWAGGFGQNASGSMKSENRPSETAFVSVVSAVFKRRRISVSSRPVASNQSGS